MSVTLQNVYEKKHQKCYFCDEEMEEGKVVEILVGQSLFRMNESWEEEDPSYPGSLATEMSYTECFLAHIWCLLVLRHSRVRI